MTFEPLSQRDERWKNIKVGTGSKSIGEIGCTITALSIALGTTPDIVNEKLKSVNGYAQTNLVIWDKLKEAFPGTEFIWRGYTYDNDKVSKNLPCLVEVDATRIGAPKHWVLYIGNQQMCDPWFGNIKATSYYPPTGYSIIKFPARGKYEAIFTKYGYPFDMPADSLAVIFEKYHEWRDKLSKGELLTKLEVESQTAKLKDANTLLTNFRNQLGKILLNDDTANIEKILEAVRDAINESDVDSNAAKYALRWFNYFNEQLNSTYTYPADLERLFTASSELLQVWKMSDKELKDLKASENKEKVIFKCKEEMISWLEKIINLFKRG